MSDNTPGREERKFPWEIILMPAFIICVYAVIEAHFLLVSRIAHSMWDPTQFPEWLKAIDTFFVYHIHAFVEFIQIVLWLLVISSTGFLAFSAVYFPSSLLGKALGGDEAAGKARKSFKEAARFMFLPIAISLITLAIIPAEAIRKPDGTILEEGQAMQFVEFIDSLSKVSYTIFIAILFLVFLFGVVGLMIKLLPDSKGFWQLPVAIVISIAASIGAAVGLFALMEPLQSRTSGYSSVLFMFGFYSLISVLTVSISRLFKWIAAWRKMESGKTNSCDAGEYRK